MVAGIVNVRVAEDSPLAGGGHCAVQVCRVMYVKSLVPTLRRDPVSRIRGPFETATVTVALSDTVTPVGGAVLFTSTVGGRRRLTSTEPVVAP